MCVKEAELPLPLVQGSGNSGGESRQGVTGGGGSLGGCPVGSDDPLGSACPGAASPWLQAEGVGGGLARLTQPHTFQCSRPRAALSSAADPAECAVTTSEWLACWGTCDTL